MPSLVDIQRFFAAMTSTDVTVGVTITGISLILIGNWRVSLLALALQYVLVTVLLATIVQFQVALVRLAGAALVVFMLYVTALGVRRRWQRRARAAGLKDAGEITSLFEREPFMIGRGFRLLGLALVAVSVWAVSSQYPFPNTTPLFWSVSLWLCSIGFLLVLITRDALKLGTGLLTFSMGFGVLYLALDPNLIFFGLLLFLDLVIALAVSHLASAPVRTEGTRRRGEI